MNYAIFGEWVRDRVEELVSMGVTREVAERSMHGVEFEAVQDIAQNFQDTQLLLNFDRLGSKLCAERYGVSPRAIRDRRTAALNRRSRRHLSSAAG